VEVRSQPDAPATLLPQRKPSVGNVYEAGTTTSLDTSKKRKISFDGNDRNFQIFTTTVCGSFGPKKDEVTGEWRKLHNEELHVLYSSPNIARVIKSRMRWAEHVARMGEERGMYRVLVGKPERKRPLWRPRRR
jgi:hypothetical protein